MGDSPNFAPVTGDQPLLCRELSQNVKRTWRGHLAKHRRFGWKNSQGRTRGFYARWRAAYRCWECCISGYGMQGHRWYAATQESALTHCRLLTWLGDYTAQWKIDDRKKDLYAPWDSGIEARNYFQEQNTQLSIPHFLLVGAPLIGLNS